MVKLDPKRCLSRSTCGIAIPPLTDFQDNKGKNFQFQTGLCTALFIFTKLAKPAVQFLYQLGIGVIIYLDDPLIAAQSEQELFQHLSTAMWLLTALEFIVNLSKSAMTPRKQIKFLDFLLDTSIMSAALSLTKISDLQKKVLNMFQQTTVSTKTLASLVGKQVATKPAVYIAPLHYSHNFRSFMASGDNITIP